MRPSGTIEWDVVVVAAGLQIAPDRLAAWFKDGRRSAWLLEEAIAERLGFTRAGETEEFDLLDNSGGKWEVRCVTKHGVYFCPSSMIGTGRSFDSRGYLQKQDAVAGWILGDIEAFPQVPYWILPKPIVETWHNNAWLGPRANVSRSRIKDLIACTPS